MKTIWRIKIRASFTCFCPDIKEQVWRTLAYRWYHNESRAKACETCRRRWASFANRHARLADRRINKIPSNTGCAWRSWYTSQASWRAILTWNRISCCDSKLVWITRTFFDATTLFKSEACNTAFTCLYYYFINHCIITSRASRWATHTSTVKGSISINTFIANDYSRAPRLKTTWTTS